MTAPDALVHESCGAHGVGVERVAPVDEQVALHLARHRGEVELLELVPLGDQHDGVGAVDHVERAVGELDVGDELARLLLGDRVVGHDLRAGGRSFFVDQRNYAETLRQAGNYSKETLERDLTVLRLLNAVPSLDPFLVREHLRNNKIDVAPCYFAISEGDQERMHQFVSAELARLVRPYDGQHAGPWLQQLNALLKRLARADYPNDNSHVLSGRAWLAFLDSRCPAAGLTRWMILVEGTYRSHCSLDDKAINGLNQAVDTWIRKHV